ncbi:hypothetical protein [Actinoplanes sp. HUAS TT8]|uniref:hypothetical protein n=1 Tax=Actinoplanes sp. HUAS TT8 TaxID=3447453 RepID=UPI003F5246AF
MVHADSNASRADSAIAAYELATAKQRLADLYADIPGAVRQTLKLQGTRAYLASATDVLIQVRGDPQASSAERAEARAQVTKWQHRVDQLSKLTGRYRTPRPTQVQADVKALDHVAEQVRVGRGSRRPSRWWLAAASVSVVLLADGAATAAAFGAARHTADQAAGQLMDRYTDDLTTAITDQVSRYAETLTDMAYSVAAQSSLRGVDLQNSPQASVALRTARQSGAIAISLAYSCCATAVSGRSTPDLSGPGRDDLDRPGLG